MQLFKDKKYVVTGGSSGIGRATAQQIIDHGGSVIITGRTQSKLDKAVSELGENASALLIDQSDLSQVMTIADKVKAISPELDGVFLNAGNGDFLPIENVNEQFYDMHFDSLVKGNYFTGQQLAPLVKSGGSVVFNVSVVTEKGMAGSSVYSATKGAVKSMVKTFAAELGPKGIRVNGVTPGPIETDFFGKMNMPDDQKAGMADMIAKTVPLGRFGTSQECANVVVFLLSDQASFVHGAEIPVDGGFAQL